MAKAKIDPNQMSDEDLILALSTKPALFSKIDKPSRVVQAFMLTKNFQKFITKKSMEKIDHDLLFKIDLTYTIANRLKTVIDSFPWESKLQAVRNHSYLIQYFSPMTDEQQIELVKANCYSIKYIKNACEAAQLVVARKGDSYLYGEMKRWFPKAQMIAVKKSAYNIRHIGNACEEAKWVAIQSYETSKWKGWGSAPTLKSMIKRPTPEMKAAIALMA